VKSLLTDPIAAEEISVRALLGLGPRNQDVGNLRQLQLAPLRGRGSLRRVMGIGMAFVAAFTMVHSVPLSIAGGWLVCALAFALWSYGQFKGLPLSDARSSGIAEYRQCHRHARNSGDHDRPVHGCRTIGVEGPTHRLGHPDREHGAG